MSNPQTPATNPDERTTHLFYNMVHQLTSTAMIFLGQMPHPETQQKVVDLTAARHFIDQLEMLEVKTRGNLSSDEAAMLKQSLMGLRMSFVHAVNDAPAAKPAPVPTPEPTPAVEAEGSVTDAPAAEEARTKFTKKY